MTSKHSEYAVFLLYKVWWWVDANGADPGLAGWLTRRVTCQTLFCCSSTHFWTCKKLNYSYWLARYWLTQFSLTNYCRQLQVNGSTDALLTAISKYRHPHPSSEYSSLYMYVSRHRREPNIKRIVWLYYCDKHMNLIIMRLFLLILTTVVNCATFDLIERLNELKGGSSSSTGQ